MKIRRAKSGPFVEQPYFTDSDVESIVTNELSRVGLLPTNPEPIRVDRFIEKRFGIVPRYDFIQDGILGFTKFGAKGPEEVVVSRSLSEEDSRVAERRINSTLAHEVGHMLLHGQIFSLQRRAGTHPLLQNDLDEDRQTILCRSDAVGSMPESARVHRYDGRWWEFQANMVIGVLLLPRQLVYEALEPLLVSKGLLGLKLLEDTMREEAAGRLSDIFNVNPAVARIRIEKLHPINNDQQLAL
ncbi:MAG: hypothetical protein OXO48_01785 [Caldilineaceae bacterium]|nr:hypothetical protein [Caldilineaceae bacterium]